ncbi:LuxR C-terminal-related transcriptional regulator [Variovorax sp. V213]|uniref:helix-turn-helix transcriptional regulator n=1 Tax=Variovorax sp. V213 TaxID=3065955 RepID=UPI0034E89983
MNDENLMSAQRRLRLSLLDTPGAIHWRPARDLAAHLLLHLDAPNDCLSIAADWLREAFDADRVDCGFGHPDDAWFRPQAEALRRDRDVPSVVGIEMNVADWGLQALWYARGVTVLRDFELERLLSQRNRAELLRMGTRVKMAAPIMDHTGPLALMCVDWLDLCEPARDERRARFEEVATVVLGPVMSTSLRIEGTTRRGTRPTQDEEVPMLLETLTPAERTVARLAVNGLSYKEIARQLDRSFSTVDHQLRSARSKLGVSSTARLVNLVSGQRRH